MADTIYEEPFLPGDPRLVDKIVRELKSQGIFDQFRKECIADVDTKPAYQNLRQRVEGSVGSFLSRQRWKPTLNKNQLREKLRKHILDSNFLDQGVERIVDQVVNPKVGSVFIPKVEDVVYQYLGYTDAANNVNAATTSYSAEPNIHVQTDLLPTDLEAISPDSVKSQEMKDDMFVNKNQSFMDTDFHMGTSLDMKDEKETKLAITDREKKCYESDEDLESPPFEPLESAKVEEHSSQESQLSGISDLTSHDSMESKLSTVKPGPPSWDTQADLDSSIKKDVSDDKGIFDSQSQDDDSSSDSHLLREMSPLTPVHNFDENSSDAQPPFTDKSDNNKKEIEVSDFKKEINFKTVKLANPPRLSVESKSSPLDGTSDDSKTSVFAPNPPEVVPLEDQFNTKIHLNDYGRSDNDSSNSNNLHIAYDSPKSEQNYDENVEYSKMKEDMSSIPLPMDLDIPMPDDDDRYKESSENRSRVDDKKSSSHHKSSRDSHRHSSKHGSSSSRHKHSSSSRDRKDSHKSDRKSDSHQPETHRSRSHHKDTEKTKEKSDHSKSSSKSKEKTSDTPVKSTSIHGESSSKSSSHRSHHSSSSKNRHSSSSSNKHGDKRENSSSDRHRSTKSDSKETSNCKDRERKDEKSSSSKDRHKSSSSHNAEKDRKHSDHKHSSSKDKYDDKKPDKKDKVKSSDDHYSSSGRAGRTRRSTDRDSNDGNNSSSKTNMPSTSKTSRSEHRRHHTNSKTDNNSVSNESSTQSDSVENKFGVNQSGCGGKNEEKSEKMLLKPVMRIENQLNTPLLGPTNLPEIEELQKVRKPRIASNIHEARKLMKIRKQMDIDEVKRQQEAALQIEIRENVAPNSSRVFSGISGPELEFTCSDEAEVFDLVLKYDSYSDEERETSDDDFDYEDDVQEDLNYFDQEEIDEAIAKSEQQIEFYKKYSENAPTTETKVYFVYCDAECEDMFKNTLHKSETIVNFNKNISKIVQEDGKMSPEIDYHLRPITVDLERDSIMSNMEEGTVYKISEIQNKTIVKKMNIESDVMIEIDAEKKQITETNIRARDEFDEQIDADLNDSILDSSIDSVNSDYYNRIDEIMNNTSKQQIMEIILGGGGDLTSSPTTKFAYNYDASYFDSPNDSPQRTVKRKASTEVFESTNEERQSVERTENNNRKVLTTNKVRKVSSTEHISSTTEGENTAVAATVRSSRFVGKARRVGLPKLKNSFTTAPKSPSSDRSVENYNENCLDETQKWLKSPKKTVPQPKIKEKRRQEMQRYDPSDLYKPRPTFLLSRRSNVN